MPIVNTVPYEVVCAPFVVWKAPVGEAFPLIDAAPGGLWTKFGTSGELNYDEEGVIVEHPQEIAEWMSGGDTGIRKVFRTKDLFKVHFTLVDITLEQYSHAINGNAITAVAASSGVAGYKKMGLSRGSNVSQYALLIRGMSPYMASGNIQYEVDIAFQTGSQNVNLGKKGTPAGLMLEFTGIINANASIESERYGRVVAQTAAAL